MINNVGNWSIGDIIGIDSVTAKIHKFPDKSTVMLKNINTDAGEWNTRRMSVDELDRMGDKLNDSETRQKIKDDLRRSMDEEIVASDDYSKRALLAYIVGDMRTVDVYDHIIEEELEHYNEFKERLEELG